MRVEKFGGASVRSAETVRQVSQILSGQKKVVVVVSAMGKTTNRLEEVVNLHSRGKNPDFQLKALRNFHLDITKELFQKEVTEAHESIEKVFGYLSQYLTHGKPDSNDELYDQIVPAGELLSTKIISLFLSSQGIDNEWVDIRKNLITDHHFRKANLNWDESQKRIEKSMKTDDLIITQGFIGGTKDKRMTTLGREGSDFTGAILANMLDAEELIVWKDVPGVMNADPRYFNHPQKLEKISYREAIELSFHGATIIHPNTIKPLQNKDITLRVRPFMDPENEGTTISADNSKDGELPIYIFKPNQVLLSISPRDFSYIDEKQLSSIFKLLHKNKIELSIMQNSAINFSICVDHVEEKLKTLINELSKIYRVFYNTKVDLLTVRHYDSKTLNQLVEGKEILLEQKTRSTIKMVIRSIDE